MVNVLPSVASRRYSLRAKRHEVSRRAVVVEGGVRISVLFVVVCVSKLTKFEPLQ